MKDWPTMALIALVVVLMLTGVGYVKFSVWTECRQANSFFYCLHLISR